MENLNAEVALLSEELQEVRKLLIALGDENRQHIIFEMIRMNRYGGIRVPEITERANLSRPAVSHHLRILKDAGILDMCEEGTKNFYYFSDDSEALKKLIAALSHAETILQELKGKGALGEGEVDDV